MRTTRDGLDLIRGFESCELAAYQDQGRRWTIGWGRARGVSPGDVCTQDEADAWFIEDVEHVEELLANCVPVQQLTDNQFSALVSFCYNVGMGAKGRKDGFRTLKSGKPSTMLKCILAGDYEGAGAEFLKWNKVAGAVCAGIQRRRLAEQALFLRAEKGASSAEN